MERHLSDTMDAICPLKINQQKSLFRVLQIGADAPIYNVSEGEKDMTTIKMTSSNRINVNGTEMYSGRITEISRVFPGTWAGVINGNSPFMLTGGKQSGGSSKEWFLRTPLIGDEPIRVNSAVEALELINNL
jgi:hypothetical protein